MANSGIYEEDYGSDHDSLYADGDADSPADGYFTQRPFPTSQFVQNSSVTAEADAKAREAAESRASNSEAQPSSQQTSPTFATRSPVWTQPEEQVPLLDAGPAPPDYAAATAHRRVESANAPSTSDQPSSPRSYGTMSESRDERPLSAESDRQWPFGNRGNPFQSQNFPFGPNGNPLSNPNFPFGADGSPFGAGNVLFPSGQPQSMGNQPPRYADNTEDDEETAIRSQYRNRRGRRGWRRLAGFCKASTTLSWLLVFGLVAVVFVFGLGDSGSHGYDKTPSSGGDSGKTPAKTPSNEDGTTPAPSEPQHPERPPSSSVPAHHTSNSCKLVHFTEDVSWNFTVDGGNFSLYEIMEPRAYMSLSMSGKLYLQPAPAEQEHDIVVTASYATSKYWRVTTRLHYLSEKDSLHLQFPNVEKTVDEELNDENSCMDVVVAVRIKEGVTIDNLDIATANLDVAADEGIFHTRLPMGFRPVQIANLTSILTIRGNVNLEYWSSRNTVIDTTSGSVKGLYALKDLLAIKTVSGTISIAVDPKDADKEHPAPAEFSAITDSGSVRVAFPMDGNIPDREYRSRVETRSGTIQGYYILGMTSTFRTVSGSITAKILPYDWDTYASGLQTETSSGSTLITVLPSYNGPDKPMRRLRALHKSAAGSGSVTLKYSQQWEGVIDAETKSGSINVAGDGLVVDVFSDMPPSGKILVGHKGSGGSRVDVRSGSGSVYFKVE